MTHPFAHHPHQLAQLLKQSLLEHQVSMESMDVTDEELALLVGGQLGQLQPQRQQQILHAISHCEELAQLVGQVTALLEQPVSTCTSSPHTRRLTIPVAMGVAWLAAACLLLMISLWRVSDPPVPISQNSDGLYAVYSVPGDVNGVRESPANVDASPFWEQYDQQQLAQRAHQDTYRDVALLILAAVVGMMTIVLIVVVMIRCRRG